jgi:hypothetical protein
MSSSRIACHLGDADGTGAAAAPDLLLMAHHPAARRGSERKSEVVPAGSVHPRHEEDVREADAWRESTEPAMRIVAALKGAIVRAERELLRVGCWLVGLDVAAEISACYVPFLTSLLSLARLGVLVLFVPALLRGLAIQHADRPDSDLLKAIAIAIGVAAVYFGLRTYVVVQVCGL